VLQQLGEVRHFVAVLRPDANEILWDDPFAEQLVEGCLKIGLLAQRKQTRSRQYFLWAEGCKVSRELLKRVTVRTLFGCGLGCRGLKQRRTCDDASVANEAGIAGDHVFDVPRCGVTKLATSFGHEILSQWCLPSTSPAAVARTSTSGIGRKGAHRQRHPVRQGQATAFKACNRLSQPAIWFQLAKFRVSHRLLLGSGAT